jgi:hypothetical protein
VGDHTIVSSWRCAPGLVAVLALCVACLPEPRPVVGKHLLLERDIGYLTFSRAPDGEAGEDAVYVKQKPDHPPIPADQGGEVGYPADLWAIGTDGGERRLLVEEIQPLFFSPFVWDARRRLIVEKRQTPWPDQLFDVLGVDIATGQVDKLGLDAGGSGGEYQLSPSGRWALVFREGSRRVAVSVDGVEIPLPNGTYPQFIGDRIYFQDESRQLVRIEDDGTTAIIADVSTANNWSLVRLVSGELLFRTYGTWDTEQWSDWQLLGTSYAGRSEGTAGFFDGTGSISPDGRRVAFNVYRSGPRGDTEQVEVHVLTPDETPPEQVWVLPPPKVPMFVSGVGLIWRPGTDEIWAIDSSAYPELYPLVLRPGQAPVPLSRPALMFSVVDPSVPGGAVQDLTRQSYYGHYGHIFIDGGRWWVSKDPGDLAVIRLSDASHPEDGGGIVLASAGQGINELAVLESGRRLAFTLGSGEEPDNLATLDVFEGSVRIVATHVAQVAFGRDRLLARSSASKAGDSSTLSMFDLTTGKESIFAENVARMVVARPCATCLPLDPGARVLFTVQARFPFERDGIWLGTLP